MAEVADEAQ
jgi:ADP-ribose pyrophosphatase YjhB (NUDIX family)